MYSNVVNFMKREKIKGLKVFSLLSETNACFSLNFRKNIFYFSKRRQKVIISLYAFDEVSNHFKILKLIYKF